jgi:hypothetical protein
LSFSQKCKTRKYFEALRRSRGVVRHTTTKNNIVEEEEEEMRKFR